MSHAYYPHLFSPIRVNTIVLPNRILAAPNNGGYSRERATAGAAVNIWGNCSVNMENAFLDKGEKYMFSHYQIEKTRKTLDLLHQGGSKASLEVMHRGMMRRSDDGVGASSLTNPYGYTCRELRAEELPEIAEKFAEACVDAKKLGFDMVMLHFAHGWLPTEFLSPAWNHRTDEYGGSYENRSKFPLMILKAVRKAVGPDYPIDMRFSVKEWVENELSWEDTLRFIKDAEPYIDMINLSCGVDIERKANVRMISNALLPRLGNIEASKQIKETVNIPVAVVGGIFTPEEAEKIIAEGYADMVMIGRPLVADPFWIKKAYEGKAEDIRPCLRCGYCSKWTTGRSNWGCSVNPLYLRDEWLKYEIEKDPERRRFVIIGGGVAGMTAALAADARGEEVILLEKSDHLGGVLEFTDHAKHKDDLRRFKNYLISQVNKRDIEVRLNTEATPETVAELHPDVLLVAIGAKTASPRIEGLDNAISALDAYHRLDDLGYEVVIIGGGTVGCELALEIADKDHHVTILEATDTLHRQDNKALDIAMDLLLNEAENITIRKQVFVRSVGKDSVTLADDTKIPCDTVITATGFRPDYDLVSSFYGITPKTYTIGDSVRSAKIKEATESAYFTVLNV